MLPLERKGYVKRSVMLRRGMLAASATIGPMSQDYNEQILNGLIQKKMTGPTKGLDATTGVQNRVVKI